MAPSTLTAATPVGANIKTLALSTGPSLYESGITRKCLIVASKCDFPVPAFPVTKDELFVVSLVPCNSYFLFDL